MQVPTPKASYWQNHVEQWQSSGLSQKAYCEQYHLKPCNLSYWKNKFEDQGEAKAESGFIPVALEPTSPRLSHGLSLQLNSGHRIEGFASVDDLVTLLRLL